MSRQVTITREIRIQEVQDAYLLKSNLSYDHRAIFIVEIFT